MQYIVYDQTGNIVTYSKSGDDSLLQALIATGRYTVKQAEQCKHCNGIGIVPINKEDK